MTRSWFAVWEMLSEREQAEVRELGGYPEDWHPRVERPEVMLRRLEGLAEIERFHWLRPGLIQQWKDELIDRVEPEEGE